MRPNAVAGPAAAAPARSKLNDLIVLTKLRLNALVVATSAGGYYMASRGPLDLAALAIAAIGTGLVASGAGALNQVDERDLDRLMHRTRLRPVADGRMHVSEGRAIALGLGFTGLLMLWAFANATAMLIALATFLIYVLVYTPLKRRTSLATVVGAVPGALPPLIGWTAAGGSLAQSAPWALFGLMFVWQLPHFLAIAWMYRDDYARAALPMLPVVDREGVLTGMQALLWAATLVPVSEMPFLLGLTTSVYAIGALVLGLGQLALAIAFARRRTEANARALFFGSITYPADSVDPDGRGKAIAAMSVSDLPHLNAALNATSGVLLAFAWWHIKQRHIATHRRFMIAAFVVSACFFASYITYHVQIGSKPFPGSGLARTIYFTILIPHVILAALTLPLAIMTLRLGLRREDRRHRRLARWTMPIWMFVSVSGVVVYLMLYQWPR